jgi:hypothetical protein
MPLTDLKTVVRKDLWVRVPRPPRTASDQGSCFQMIEVVGRAFDALDGFRTDVHDPVWPYFVGPLRLLIRTFVNYLPTNGGCNGLSSIKPFPETVLLQARNSVDLHVRDPTVPGSGGVVNELST